MWVFFSRVSFRRELRAQLQPAALECSDQCGSTKVEMNRKMNLELADVLISFENALQGIVSVRRGAEKGSRQAMQTGVKRTSYPSFTLINIILKNLKRPFKFFKYAGLQSL